MFSRSFYKGEQKSSKLKQKQLTARFFATLSFNTQFTPVEFSIEHETVVGSRKNQCHVISAVFGHDHNSICKIYIGKKFLDANTSFSFNAVTFFTNKMGKNLQEPATLKDVDNTDKIDPTGKRIFQAKSFFQLDSSLRNLKVMKRKN